jgi:hypothetical protein
MEIGKLYRLNSKQKEKLLKLQELYVRYATTVGINVCTNNQHEIFPIDTLIVPLEIYSVTENGTPLSGKNSKRLKVLLSTGDVGIIYLSTDEWEEATA